MEISKEQKQSCLIGSRASFGLACLVAKKHYQDLTIFTADTLTSAGLQRFKKKYAQDIIEVSISEQVLVSSASGYALSGGRTIATTFAPFLTMRAYEMIRHNLGYMEAPVLLVGLAAGVAFGQLGYTHCCIEDVAIISSIPGIDIYSPIDPSLIKDLVLEIQQNNKPTYLRLTGEPNLLPVPLSNKIDTESFCYQIATGSDIILITTGSITSFAYEAYKMLPEEIRDLVGMYSICKIKPLRLDFILEELSVAKKILVIEEGVINGFYAEFVVNYPQLAHKSKPLCHPNEYLKCGSYEYMLEKAKLDSISIYNEIKSLL